MTTIIPYPHIEKIEGQAARLTRLPRIRVAQIVMDYLAHGWSVGELCRHYPYLQPAEAHAAMAYYFDNQPELDTEIRQEWLQVQQETDSVPLSPFAIRMKAQGLL
ncbi:MAG: DUF433 domain-containing protein [Elainellaceae cyanobacterium]